MRVLMCNSFHYLRGGAERCFLELMTLLRAHGHEVIPFCMAHPQNLPSAYEQYFVSYVDFPTLLREGNGIGTKLQVAERTIYSREARRKIEQLIRATRPDIAHVHGIAHETSPSILPAIKAAGIPIVQTLHDYKLLCPNTSFISQGKVCEQCKGHRYYNVVRNRCKRDSLSASMLAGVEMYLHKFWQIYESNVDLFITPSRFLKEKVAEHGVKNQVVHLPNFVDPGEFPPVFEADDYFVFCGRLVALKGVRTLLRAMQSIKRSHLYIAGNGELENELHAEAAQQGIANITFLGHLGKEQLVPLVQRAAFTIAPSEWYENYPMTVLESLACGTPVVGARIGGIPELVIDGQTGVLYESGNVDQLVKQINFMLDNRALALEMGRKGRTLVETMNAPEQHYQQTLQIYQTLLQKKAA
jgi:glycosyltransferase involved in cell wall biosynthesis